MAVLLFFAFLSGLVTVLTPCIWPLLPIVLSTSIIGKGRLRPIGITLGIVLSFGVLVLAISSLVKIFNFDPNVLRLVSVGVIGFLGLTLLWPALSERLELVVGRLAGVWGQGEGRASGGLVSGLLTGATLGVLWSPCAGPILAAVATLSAMGRVTGEVVAVMGSYMAGIGIPLFVFVYGGQQVATGSRFFLAHTRVIQQVFGGVMILMALLIYNNYDQYLQTKLLNAIPLLGTSLNGFESNQVVTQQLNVLKGKTPTGRTVTTNGLFNENINAPDFSGITKWLNLPSGVEQLSLRDLKGKVVLLDFWTYTCINCLRTLPYVTSWYNKYKTEGFVVVGVHTPEFEFEKETANVQEAIKKYGISYPVAQDNNYSTWNSYNNQYWPAEYLIDGNGKIRRTHFGEGEYDQMEMAIQALLGEDGKQVNMGLSQIPDQTPRTSLSPETYLGSVRMTYYYPGGSLGNGTKVFNLTGSLPQDSFDLGGKWTINDEEATALDGAVLEYSFYSNKVFLVLRPGAAGVGEIKILVDGTLASTVNAGSDVVGGEVTIDTDRLYNLVDLKGQAGNHRLRIEFETPGVEVFAFTFG